MATKLQETPLKSTPIVLLLAVVIAWLLHERLTDRQTIGTLVREMRRGEQQ